MRPRLTASRAVVLTLVVSLALDLSLASAQPPITTLGQADKVAMGQADKVAITTLGQEKSQGKTQKIGIDAPRYAASAKLRQAIRQAVVVAKHSPAGRWARTCKAAIAATCSLLPRRAPVLLYQGAFDPVHRGHLANLRAALAGLPRATQVYVVPTSDHPGKTPVAFEHRVAMMQAALRDAGLPASVKVTVVDDAKLARLSAHGFDDLTAMIHGRHPGAPLTIMTGADAFVSATEAGLVSKALRGGYRYAVTPREGYALPARLPFGVAVMPQSGGHESSTAIRAAIAAGRRPADLTPSTLRYLLDHDLYGARSRP